MPETASPSAVEARFYISGLERNSYNPDATIVKMQVVTRGAHNKNWAAATPAGQVQMTVANPSAASWFTERLGQELSVTFAPAPAEET